MKMESNTNMDTQHINLEICNNDLFRLINVGRSIEIWQYLNRIETNGIRGIKEIKHISYYFFNHKNNLHLTIETDKQGIAKVYLFSITKKINITMDHNIEYNAFYDLLSLFLRSNDRIDIETLNEKKEAN